MNVGAVSRGSTCVSKISKSALPPPQSAFTGSLNPRAAARTRAGVAKSCSVSDVCVSTASRMVMRAAGAAKSKSNPCQVTRAPPVTPTTTCRTISSVKSIKSSKVLYAW